MGALLEIKNIETYYDLIYAIRGVSLSVTEGSITTILGNNGAGKTTILKTVLGLIDNQPDKGTIEFMALIPSESSVSVYPASPKGGKCLKSFPSGKT